MTKFKSSEVAELLKEWLRYHKLHEIHDESAIRRIHDITNGKTQVVTLQAFDRICTAVGHQEWMQLVTPL